MPEALVGRAGADEPPRRRAALNRAQFMAPVPVICRYISTDSERSPAITIIVDPWPSATCPLSHRRDQLGILVVVIADHQSAVEPRQIRHRNRSGTDKRGALDSALGGAEGRWDEKSGSSRTSGSSRNVQECRVRRRMEPPWVGAVYDSPECSATEGAGQGFLPRIFTEGHG